MIKFEGRVKSASGPNLKYEGKKQVMKKSKVMAKAPQRMSTPFTKLGKTTGAAGHEGTGNQAVISGLCRV